MNIAKEIEKNPDVSVALLDSSGNVLYKYKNGEVFVHIATESKPRRVGHIREGMLFVERNSAEHTHRKSNSYGFNYYLLKHSASFTKVAILEDGEAMYYVPKDTIMKFGKVMNFKNSADGNSFELQIFLNKSLIIPYKSTKEND